MDELLEQFIIEAREGVAAAADDVLALRQLPADAARIGAAFRAIHTVKGGAGLFDFAPLGRVLHAAEDVLGAWRARGAASPAEIDAVLDCVAVVEGWVEAVAATQALPAGAAAVADSLVRRLGGGAAAAPPAPVADAAWVADYTARFAPDIAAWPGSMVAVRYVPAADCFFRGDDPLALARRIPDLRALRLSAREAWDLQRYDPFRCNLVIEALSGAALAEVAAVMRLTGNQTQLATVSAPASPEAAARVLRVDAARVDAVADMLGELTVAKNALAHLAPAVAAAAPGLGRALAARLQEIDRLTGGLHRAVAGMRLVPLGQVLRRLTALARETAQHLGKQLRIEVSGGEVAADKSVADGLYDMLLHAVRNAVDHGIEFPAARLAAGKPEAGLLRVVARQDGALVVMTVTDDGAGVDPARIRARVIERGLRDAATLAALDDAAVLDLVFLPGFSTADAVTDISGRGVGLDAVRRAAAALGGRVSLASTPGQGSCLTLSVPQAVAVTTVIVVRVGPERFGVKLECIAETLLLRRDQVMPVASGAAFVLRQRTVPLLALAALLGLPAPPATDDIKVLVLLDGDQRVGIAVDGFGARLDVVLRPLTGLLARFDGIIGSALMGDGSVLMVLDLAALALRAAAP